MVSKEIKKLVEKYWAGKTTPDEEGTLKAWYTKHADGSDPETERYFSMLGNFNKIVSDPKVELKLPENAAVRPIKQPRRFNYTYLSRIAAVMIVAVGIGLIWKMQPQQINEVAVEEIYTQEEIQQSYEEAKTALLLIAAKLNKGKDAMEQLDKFSETKQRISEKKMR